MSAIVVAVSRKAEHTFSKDNQSSIRLLHGLGVEGDAKEGQIRIFALDRWAKFGYNLHWQITTQVVSRD